MAEPALPRVGDFEVAERALRIDVDGCAALDAFDDLEADVADCERTVEQLELVPGWPARDVQVGAKAQGVDDPVDEALDGGNACKIDDRDDLAGDVREAMAFAGENLWGPLEVIGKIRREEV